MDLRKKIIFVSGASRSGTTMMCHILDQHSEIHDINELHVFGDLITSETLHQPLTVSEQHKLASAILQRDAHGIWAGDRPLRDTAILQTVLERLGDQEVTAADVFEQSVFAVGELKGTPSIAEQTPRNVFFAEAILKAYPHAQFVHMVRDPRAVLASQKSKWRLKFLGGDSIPKLEVIRMWTNYHPITLSKLWSNANSLAKKHESHERFHVIKFEKLLEAPELTLRNLCQSLGIEFQDKMLDIEHIGSSHQHNKSPATGISNATVESWKKNLSSAEQLVSEKLCATTMSHYGYEPTEKKGWPILGLLVLLLKFPVHVIGVVLFNFKRALVQLRSITNRASSS